jgi:hypothetical protein
VSPATRAAWLFIAETAAWVAVMSWSFLHLEPSSLTDVFATCGAILGARWGGSLHLRSYKVQERMRRENDAERAELDRMRAELESDDAALPMLQSDKPDHR